MSSDEMPCGCLGHADYDHLCRYPVLEAETKSLREQVRTLTEQLNNTGRARAEMESVAVALRTRVAELEAERDVERTMRLERETLLAGAREREEIAQAAVAQAVRERDTARAAAVEEAAQHLFRRSAEIRAEAETTTPQLAALKDARSLVAGERLNMGHELRALKAQPARRFVEAEKVVDLLRLVAARCWSDEATSKSLNDGAAALGLEIA